ncbi:hypothetical protein FA13DRAFT_1190862 [Coprinellus micaceus]|uniref:Uncharacterized protein n=1 Tax=Coprinellus micaceus TaxID=71717 RepID=A0A4Y7STL2_COPMI|nr:hypothetical protein FA13DRAFT_1190862 [Coprinellus micaceus]
MSRGSALKTALTQRWMALPPSLSTSARRGNWLLINRREDLRSCIYILRATVSRR